MGMIHVVTATDENYIQHVAVMLYSLLINKHVYTSLNIYIIHNGISKASKKKLLKVTEMFNNVRVDFKHIKNKYRYDRLKTNSYTTAVTYYRISLPDLLNKSIKKAIYLDSDLIVKQDLKPLWQTDIHNYCLAAVVGPNGRKKSCQRLSIPKKYDYFNAGVLLVNLDRWRKLNIPTRVLHFIKNHPSMIRLMDQDGLNAVLYKEWTELHPKWNVQTAFFIRYHKKYKQAIQDPAIIHFTGPRKPWHKKCNHPFKGEYDKYRRSIERIVRE